MKRIRTFLTLGLTLSFLLLIGVIAQETQESTEETGAEETTTEETASEETSENKRIISIRCANCNQSSANLRFGPITYSHPDPDGVTATVSNLTILSSNATLSAPEGTPIAEAQGEREASFENGVAVERGRLDATGPGLVYSEVTGLGVMSGPAEIMVAPKEEDDDPVDIVANEVTFDVDTDVSISRGEVSIISGNQSAQADELTFEEERDLAVMVTENGQTRAVRIDEDGNELTIDADVIRFLTEEDKLLATGNVTLIDGDITTTGHTVFFDDTNSRAEVLGEPAVSVNEAEGFTVSGARLEQLTDLDIVEVLDDSVPPEFDSDEFELSTDLEERG